ncbi:MAG: hypothetical protein ACREM3_13010 [Candidatus Rokuibacteriota bacterium]
MGLALVVLAIAGCATMAKAQQWDNEHRARQAQACRQTMPEWWCVMSETIDAVGPFRRGGELDAPPRFWAVSGGDYSSAA